MQTILRRPEPIADESLGDGRQAQPRNHSHGRGRWRSWLVTVLAGVIFASFTTADCWAQAKKRPFQSKTDKNKKKTPPVIKLDLNSAAFEPDAMIPKNYTADGKNISPAINWSEGPEKTKNFALICEDPDAPKKTWVHWVVYDLPADMRVLPEGVSAPGTLPEGVVEGKNDFGKIGYGGPAPPQGKPHRYVFHLYALDKPIGLPAGASKDELLVAMKGHILAEGQIVGRYARKPK
jgi:Raf kinase inhibitor-like YbhB/YbcL family protein